jgi:glycosyltransferase involved in cell wall biosynthesis
MYSNKKNIIYITNTRIPSDKANSYQSVMMCESFSVNLKHVEIWYPDRGLDSDKNLTGKDIAKIYGIDKEFSLKKVKTIDSRIIYKISKKSWARLHKIVFALNCILRLLVSSNNITIYSRDEVFLRVYFFLKKVGLVRQELYFEAHRFSPKIVRYLSNIDGLIVINKNLERLYKEQSIQNVLVSYDGVKLKTFKEIPIKKAKSILGLDENIKYITYVGRLNTMGGEKGVLDIIKSLTYIQTNNVKLLLVGGPISDSIKYQLIAKKLNVESKVVFVDRQPVTDLYKYLSASSVLLMPFPWTEHYAYYMSPLKMFEYMAMKRPIVASKLPSIEEVLRHKYNAILCENDNPKDLSKKVDWALKNDCSKLVLQAFNDVKNYTWNERAVKIIEFVNK